MPGTYDEVTLTMIDRFLADYAIISPVGLSAELGASDFLSNEAEVARAMLRRAKRNIFLCTANKFGVESRVSICQADEIDVVVTDSPPALPLSTGSMIVA